MPPDSKATRARLISAAEHLFARRGLDVPVRDIHALAGQRNASALQYHFGDRQGLVQAVLEKHAPSDAQIEAAQQEYASLHPDAHKVVAVVLGRFCSNLATPEGRDWARMRSHIVLRAPIRDAMLKVVTGGNQRHSPSLEAVLALVREHVPELSPDLAEERALGAMQFMTFMVAERARFIDDEDSERATDEQAFIANLVDMTVGAITAPARSQSRRQTAAATRRTGRTSSQHA